MPLRVVAPVTVKDPVTVVVARLEFPPTVSKLEIVVEPVMPRVLEELFQVKLPLPPVVVAAE